ncbi:hypothetical protein [Cohnella sp.]|uniref:hypothetical protein n=1 Tax=Cohnella sp. TaxID=1883426 RepID=UPI00356A9CCE
MNLDELKKLRREYNSLVKKCDPIIELMAPVLEGNEAMSEDNRDIVWIESTFSEYKNMPSDIQTLIDRLGQILRTANFRPTTGTKEEYESMVSDLKSYKMNISDILNELNGYM